VDRLGFSDSARLAFGFWYGGAASTIRAGGDISEARGVSARGRRDEGGEEGEGDDPETHVSQMSMNAYG
jgi:hypothetical protein